MKQQNTSFKDERLETDKVHSNKTNDKSLKALKRQQKKEAKAQKKAQRIADRKQKKLENKKERLEKNRLADWFKLDNAATIYPSIKDENWSFVVRFSAILNEKVDKDVLQQAVIDTMPRFPTFNVGLKQGIFWNYFEEKSTFPKVTKEEKFPCISFDLFDNKSHIVRILYYNNRISVECFHGVADGRSILVFLNTLLRRYFILKGVDIKSTEGCLNTLDKPRKEGAEDAFFKNSTKGEKSTKKENMAFHIKGTKEEFGVVNAIMGTMSVKQVKGVAKSFGCTITEFLVSYLAFAVWKKNKNHNKPIKISVPIDLRQFFETETLRNFSGYINVEIPPKSTDYLLMDIIEIVKEEFNSINRDNMQAFINSNVGMQKNFFIKIVPLFLKNLIIKLVYRAMGEAYQTMNISNIGVVKVPQEFEGKIEKYCINLGRPKYNAKTVGVISYNDNLVITFSSKIKETDVEEAFFSGLSQLGINVLIESNRRDLYA